MRRETEKSFFFKNRNGDHLFATVFLAEEDTTKGILFCQPIAEERHRLRRIIINWARFLRVRKFNVLVFDYFGEGDSDGKFEEASVSSRIEDILDSQRYMVEELQFTDVGLVGARLGASLAALASNSGDKFRFLIQLQPVVSGSTYVQEWLKMNLASQFVRFKRIKHNRQKLISILNEKGFLEIEGYIFAKEFYEELVSMDLCSCMQQGSMDALIIEVVKGKESKEKTFEKILTDNPTVDHIKIDKTFDWKTYRNYRQHPHELYFESFRWLEKSGH